MGDVVPQKGVSALADGGRNGPDRAPNGHFDPRGSIRHDDDLDRRGQIWTGVSRSGQAWADLDRRGQIWTGVGRFGQARGELAQTLDSRVH